VHYLEKDTMSQIGAPLVGSYDYRIVALSILIATTASYAALDLGGRVTAARGWTRLAWLAGGATAMGFGIWSMHFTGMLAFNLPIPIAYHWPTVLLSLLAAILASAVALYVASRKEMDRVQALTGGLIMGLGIAGMHYIGMAAMRMPAVCHYSPLLVTLSVLIAVIASLAALGFPFDYREHSRSTILAKVISATLMGAAISLMHYTGMMAATFFPSTILPDISHAVTVPGLGLSGIAIGTFVVQALAVLTSSVDRQLAAQAQELQTSERFRQIADFLKDVLLLSNRDLSEVLFVNRAYEAIWGRTVESLYAAPRSWLEGVHPDDRQQVEEALRRLVDGESLDYVECRVVRDDGSISWVRLRARPVLDSQGHPYRIVGSFHEFTTRKLAEEQVKQAENRLRLVLDTTPALIHSGLPDGYLDYFNQRWLEYIGLPIEDVQGWGWTSVIHPEDVDGIVGKWRACLASGEPFLYEARVRRADGEYRWMLHHKVPLRDEHGNIVKWYGSSIDIEDRKRAEVQARTLIDAIPQQIWSGPPDGTIDYCNERWRSETGLRLEDLRDEGWMSIIHPDDQERVLKAWRDSVANGTPYEQEERHRRADGTYRWVLSRGVPLRDAEGRIVRWYGTNTDIEDRKRAEQELRQSEDRIRAILDFSPNWIFLKDTEGRYLLVSKEVERVFRVSQEQIIGKTDSEIFPAKLAAEIRANDLKVLREGVTMEFEEIADLEDGRHTSIVHKFPLFDTHGNIYATGGVATDITERKKAEIELRRLSGQLLRLQDEERRRIARDLHDSMGQDLVALATMLSQLRGAIPSTERKSRRILSECKVLADKCIRDVRTLSYVLHPPVLDEAGLGDAIRDYVAGFTRRSGIQVELEVPPRVGRMERDIELVLFRVVQESLTNIQRHSGSQRAKIRVIRNSHLTLEISDLGRGLSATEQSGKEETRLEFGVGIPSMQERVKLIGGRLEINSSSHGTSVRVTIPLGENQREKTAHFAG
jgi:PAS domain S-box-containing protein